MRGVFDIDNNYLSVSFLELRNEQNSYEFHNLEIRTFVKKIETQPMMQRISETAIACITWRNKEMNQF